MTTFTRQDRQKAVTQTLAIWALEGFEPDADYLTLCNRYIHGELTPVQLGEMINAQYGVTPQLTGGEK
jgi:hypothetical protein